MTVTRRRVDPAAFIKPNCTPRFCGSLRGWLWALALLSLPWVSAQAARQALVIGNAAYIDSPLKNPVNDAHAMEAKLRSLGFEVMRVDNLKRQHIGRTLGGFASRIRPGDEVVVFYAGHGLQVKGVNYLPAVDAEINNEDDVPLNSLNLSSLLDRLDESKAGVKLLFLDACRNNPFARSIRTSGSRGLARVVDTPSGTLMHFATRPGMVAADGTGVNGLYTTELLKHIDTPGLPVELMLKEVAQSVEQASGGTQEPWMEGNLKGHFVFRPVQRPDPVRPDPLPNRLGGLSLEDLRKEQAAREEWAQWQARMKADFEAAASFNGNADLQAKAWERFLNTWPQDNPLSTEDEGLRNRAQQALAAAQQRAKPQPEKPSLKPAPTPAQTQAATTPALPPAQKPTQKPEPSAAGDGRAEAPATTPSSGSGDERYLALGDGSRLRDTMTGLVWARCRVGQRWEGQRCVGSAKTLSFDQAKALEKEGWRMPSKAELASFAFCNADRQRLRETGNGRTGQQSNDCSGYANTGTSDGDWVVGFGDVVNSSNRLEVSFQVRLVEAPQIPSRDSDSRRDPGNELAEAPSDLDQRSCDYRFVLTFGGQQRDCMTRFAPLMDLPGQPKDWVPGHGIFSLAVSDGPSHCVGQVGVATSNNSTHHTYQTPRDDAALRQCLQALRSALGEARSSDCSCSIAIQNGAMFVSRSELLRRLGVKD